MASKTKFRVAIVGCGQIVTHHAGGMAAASDGWEVTALVDPDTKRRSVIEELVQEKKLLSNQRQEGLAQYNSLDAFLASSSSSSTTSNDVIFIAVPHDLHEKLAMQALENTPSTTTIVLEKPLSITRDSLDRLVAYSAKHQGRLIVAEQSPYWEEVVRAKELIHHHNAIGERILSAAAYYYESMRDNVTSGGLSEDGCGLGWRGLNARAGGGIAMDGGLHWIRPLREMCGQRIAKVTGVVRAGLQPALQMEGESIGHALFEMHNNNNNNNNKNTTTIGADDLPQYPLIATYSCNMLATAPMAHDTCPYFRITGDAGELVIHGDGLLRQPGAGGLRLYNEKHPNGKEEFPADRTGGFFRGFAGLWKEIYRIKTDGDCAAAHESVVRAADDVRVVLALYESSKSRQWEEC